MCDFIDRYKSPGDKSKSWLQNHKQIHHHPEFGQKIDRLRMRMWFSFGRTVHDQELTRDKNSFCVVEKTKVVYDGRSKYDVCVSSFEDLSCLANYSVRSQIQLQQRGCLLSVVSTLHYQNLPFSVKHASIRLLLFKFINKLNSTLKHGSFKINPFNGQLSHSLVTCLSEQQYEEITLYPTKCIELTDTMLTTSSMVFQYNIYKILFLACQIYPQSMRYLQSTGKEFRKVTLDQGQIRCIQLGLQYSEYQFSFTAHSQATNSVSRKYNLAVSRENFNSQAKESYKIVNKDRKILNVFQTFSLNRQDKNPQSDQCFQIVRNTQRSQAAIEDSLDPYETIERFYEPKKNLYQQFLHIPNQKTSNPNEKLQIYNEIMFLNPSSIEWELVDEGGWGYIQKGVANFVFQCLPPSSTPRDQIQILYKNKDKKVSKLLALKRSKNPLGSKKIGHEKQILSLMANSSCAHLTKFYHSNQQLFKGVLLMDYYNTKNLEVYLGMNRKYVSMLAKLYFLCQSAQALRFLKDHRVIHLDFKPDNLLVSKGLIIRLSDFGEAYHPEVCSSGKSHQLNYTTFFHMNGHIDYTPGFTIPYAAPEIFCEGKIEFSEAQDVFGLGVTMYKILLENSPIEVRRSSFGTLISRYSSHSKQDETPHLIKGNLEIGSTLCPSLIMQMISNLCLRCMHTDPRRRPRIEWVIIVLRQIMHLIEKMY